MVGDTDIPIEVERRSLEKVELINPVHDGKGHKGNQYPERSFISEENRHEDLVNEVAVPLSDLELRVLELFVQLALESIDSVLIVQIPVSEQSLDLFVDPRRMDELVEDLDGRAVGDEVVGVEVEVVVGALEDVQ